MDRLGIVACSGEAPGSCGNSDALLLCAAGIAAAGLCCSVCHKTFKSRNSLRNHRTLHEGRTVCTICGRVFSTLTNLYQHRRLVHVTLPPPSAQHPLAAQYPPQPTPPPPPM